MIFVIRKHTGTWKDIVPTAEKWIFVTYSEMNVVSFYYENNVADFAATYEETSTTALSAKPAVAVPLLTVNGWILMQRKVTGGSVSFNKTWAEYRDGFGSAAGNDNYWLGLDKVYRLMQLGGVRLRVEVCKLTMLIKKPLTSTIYYVFGAKYILLHCVMCFYNAHVLTSRVLRS